MKETNSEIAIPIGAAALDGSTSSTEKTLEELYAQYARSLFRYALSLVSSPDDAEDAVQEVFIRIARDHKRIARIRNLKAYLFTATRNAAYNQLRGRKRRDELSESLGCDFTDTSELDVNGLAEAEIANRAFALLPIEQREVLALKVFEQMTFDEIARAIGVSINTVSSRYRYGIAKLRQALGG